MNGVFLGQYLFFVLPYIFQSLARMIYIMYNIYSPGDSDGKASACNAGDLGSIPGLGRSPGEGNGNPLQYSCLENPMDRGGWQGPWGRKELNMT